MSPTSPIEPPAERWRDRIRFTVPYAVHVGFLLFVVCAAGVFSFAVVQKTLSLQSLILGMVDPAMASCVLPIVAALVPNVFAPGHPRPIHAITIPILFLSLVAVLQFLDLTGPGTLERLDGIARLDRLWNSPVMLGAMLVAQVLLLSRIMRRVPAPGAVK